MYRSPGLVTAGLLLLVLVLGACSDDKEGDEVAVRSPLAAMSSSDTDTVPASANTNLPGEVRATKLLTNEELQLDGCTKGNLTNEAETVSLGWVVPNRGITAFVDQGVCDVAVANGAAVLCGGGHERFADDPAQLETSGGQLTICTQSGSSAAFLTVSIPSGGAWLAVQQGGLWDVYKVGDRPIVRVVATEGLEPTGDRITLTAKVLDSSGALLSNKTVKGAVAG